MTAWWVKFCQAMNLCLYKFYKRWKCGSRDVICKGNQKQTQKRNQYFVLLNSYVKTRKFRLLKYLLVQVMEHHQQLVTTMSTLLTLKSKAVLMSLPFIVSFIDNIWKTSCTIKLSLLQWIKLKLKLVMTILETVLRMMKILNICCFILKFTGCQRKTERRFYDFLTLLWSFFLEDTNAFLSNKLEEIRHDITYLSKYLLFN